MLNASTLAALHQICTNVHLSVDVACQAKRKKVTRKTQKTALIHPIYGNQSGFSYVI